MKKLILFLIVFPLLFSCDEKGNYSEGYATVKDFSTDLYGYVDDEGNMVIEKQYDYATAFQYGLAVVKQSAKYGVINKMGEFVIPAKFDYLKILNSKFIETEINLKSGLVNLKGQEIIPNAYDKIEVVPRMDYLKVYEGERYGKETFGIFSTKGKKLSHLAYTSLDTIINGIAVLKSKTDSDFKLDYFLIDLKTNKDLLYRENYTSIVNGFAKDASTSYFILERNNYLGLAYAVVDNRGDHTIPFHTFDKILGYGSNLFLIYKENAGFGFANEKGELVIKPIFDKAENFSGSIAKVTLGNSTFFINKKGRCAKNCPSKSWLQHYDLENIFIDNKALEEIIRQGTSYSEKGNYAKAIELFSEALKINPNSSVAYFHRGMNHLLNDQNDVGFAKLLGRRFDLAIEDFTKAIKYNNSYAEAYYYRGIAYQQTENERAILDFEKAIEIEPGFIDAYLKAAIEMGNRGWKNSACNYLKKACDLGSPKGCEGYYSFCN